MQVLGMQSPPSPPPAGHFDPSRHTKRKRKADVSDGERERLSKRLSLLRLEQSPHSKRQASPDAAAASRAHRSSSSRADHPGADDSMQLDDSKHRIYIHSLDDELSSDSECEDGRLVFPPHVRQHLLQNSIPRRILANDEGEIAGMQVVLYNEPKALSVPEEQDSVRRAVTEARERLREKQRMERRAVDAPHLHGDVDVDLDVDVDGGREAGGGDDDDMMEID